MDNLFLSGNQLTSLPPEIGNLTSIEVLDLRGNQLASLPPEIGNLVGMFGAGLKTLYLSNNQLTSLPPEIGNLTYLQWLDLGNNQLSGLIPAFLSNLGNLYNLTLSQNPGLTCWETEEARDWALSLSIYDGPTCYFP
jgi:internalin A